MQRTWKQETFYMLTWYESFASLEVISSVHVDVQTEMRQVFCWTDVSHRSATCISYQGLPLGLGLSMKLVLFYLNYQLFKISYPFFILLNYRWQAKFVQQRWPSLFYRYNWSMHLSRSLHGAKMSRYTEK